MLWNKMNCLFVSQHVCLLSRNTCSVCLTIYDVISIWKMLWDKKICLFVSQHLFKIYDVCEQGMNNVARRKTYISCHNIYMHAYHMRWFIFICVWKMLKYVVRQKDFSSCLTTFVLFVFRCMKSFFESQHLFKAMTL